VPKMEIETTIIGAGVIGLSIAAELSKQDQNIYVIESNATFGNEISRRNNEVIHAGIYYPKGSLKARLCVEGNRLLRRLCESSQIPYRMCGKLIVATSEEEAIQLETLATCAKDNGVNDLDLLSGAECKKIEPQLRAEAALYSPSSGIIDSQSLIRNFVAQAGMNGVNFVYQTRVEKVVKISPGQYAIYVVYPDGETERFTTRRLINAAGLDADRMAASMGLDIDQLGYRQYFWKGEYFSVQWPVNTIKKLIYPVPEPQMAGLGVGVITDLSGRLRLGPNAIFMSNRALEDTAYPARIEDSFNAARRYLPALKREDISLEMAGIRPKLQRPGDPLRDFIIQEESANGFPGVVNLAGIESPGLTACIAIANHVKRLIA
jgi:L-2-hydroxyglutarate oxidase LhgO